MLFGTYQRYGLTSPALTCVVPTGGTCCTYSSGALLMWGVTLRSPGQVFSPQSWLQETHQDSVNIRVSQVLKCQLNITTPSPPNHQHPISVVVVLKQLESFKFPPLHFQTTAAYSSGGRLSLPRALADSHCGAATTTAVKPFIEVLNSGNSAPAEEPRNIDRRRTADRMVPVAQGVAVSFRLFDT